MGKCAVGLGYGPRYSVQRQITLYLFDCVDLIASENELALIRPVSFEGLILRYIVPEDLCWTRRCLLRSRRGDWLRQTSVGLILSLAGTL